MRTALACLTILSVISLVAVRPAAPTLSERVADLERRVAVLENAAKPPAADKPAPRPTFFKIGMTMAEAKAAMPKLDSRTRVKGEDFEVVEWGRESPFADRAFRLDYTTRFENGRIVQIITHHDR